MTSILQTFGYTETEAQFQELVIHLGGYFVRRQFNRFAGCQTGGRTQNFVYKLLGTGHARMTVNRHARQVIHVHFKPFYRALACEDTRNRRAHQPRAIRARLMALDYRLANPEGVLLASESEKRAYLIAQGIASTDAPSRIDKFLIATASGNHTRPSFLFIDDGAVTVAGFETALRHAMPVFEQIREFELGYLACHSALFEKAEAAFRGTVLGLGTAFKQRPDVDRLLHYFADLERYESRQTADFNKRRLDQLRDLQDEFSAPIHSALYHLWLERGETAVRERIGSGRGTTNRPAAEFRAVVLEHDYAIFDNLLVAS